MNKRLFLKIKTLGCEKHQHLDQKKKKKKSRKVWTQMKRELESEEGLRDSLRAGAEVGAQGRLQN